MAVIMNPHDELHRRNHGKEMILSMRTTSFVVKTAAFMILRPFQIWQRYIILQRLYACLRQIKIQMEKIFAKSARLISPRNHATIL